MTRLLTTLSICLASMLLVSDQANAADHNSIGFASETKTAFFQPRPGGVLDVVTSPFRALTSPVSYGGHQSYRGQSIYGRANCVNGRCYPTGYRSPCANGNCSTGYGYSNCPGGNCGTTRYLAPYQNHTGYRGTNWNSTQQYPTYRPAYQPVSRPVYKPYTPSNSIRNDPFFR